MQYKVLYDKHIPRDIKKIPQNLRGGIAKSIQEKLLSSPEFFGKPLRNVLHPWRSLRVGKYRVVFEIKDDFVIIRGIIHRDVVYDILEKRKG